MCVGVFRPGQEIKVDLRYGLLGRTLHVNHTRVTEYLKINFNQCYCDVPYITF